MSLSEYSVIKREINGNRSVPSNFMSNIEYSVIKSDVIKSFDCIKAEIVPCPKHRLVLVSNIYQHKVCTQK